MTKLLVFAAIALGVLGASKASAAEKTITLAVKNMYCDACPLIVRKSLESVPGVNKAVVSYKDKSALVTYDLRRRRQVTRDRTESSTLPRTTNRSAANEKSA
jgi:periplasmic mercuric ion binding protein